MSFTDKYLQEIETRLGALKTSGRGHLLVEFHADSVGNLKLTCLADQRSEPAWGGIMIASTSGRR